MWPLAASSHFCRLLPHESTSNLLLLRSFKGLLCHGCCLRSRRLWPQTGSWKGKVDAGWPSTHLTASCCSNSTSTGPGVTCCCCHGTPGTRQGAGQHTGTEQEMREDCSDTCPAQTTRQNHLVMLMRHFSNNCPLRIPRCFSCKNWALWCYFSETITDHPNFLFLLSQISWLMSLLVSDTCHLPSSNTGQFCYHRNYSHFLFSLYFVTPKHPNISVRRRPFTEAESRTEFGVLPHTDPSNFFFFFYQLMINLEICRGGKPILCALHWPLTPWPKLKPCLPGSATSSYPFPHFNDISERQKESAGFGGMKTVS